MFLIVDDSNGQWAGATPGPEPNIRREFSGYCYLGEEKRRSAGRRRRAPPMLFVSYTGEKMNMLTKLISGDQLRKSRLHDEKGNFASWKNVLLHAPPAALSGFLRISMGYRPNLPWIAYSSIRILSSFLNKNSRVLEFGSGMSTIWYAKHAGAVFSIEDHKPWYEKVSAIIANKRLRNVTYRFTETESEYYSFMSDDVLGFDLVMVDGNFRSKCVSHASKLVRPGGILYLDNSDKDSAPHGGDMRSAESLVRNLAKEMNAEITEVTDFAPTQFFVQQGLYAKFPGSRSESRLQLSISAVVPDYTQRVWRDGEHM